MPDWLFITITVLTCLVTVGLFAEWMANRIGRNTRQAATRAPDPHPDLPPTIMPDD